MVTRTAATPNTIRKWALKDQRFKKVVGTRGRLPSAVIEAYLKEHPEESYVDSTTGVFDVESMLEQAQGLLKAGVALQSVMELVETMEDPSKNFYHPDVARDLRSRIDQAMKS